MAKKTKELFQQELIKNGTKKAITTEIKIETEFFYAEGKSQIFFIVISSGKNIGGSSLEVLSAVYFTNPTQTVTHERP